jgi:hypothetical protein
MKTEFVGRVRDWKESFIFISQCSSSQQHQEHQTNRPLADRLLYNSCELWHPLSELCRLWPKLGVNEDRVCGRKRDLEEIR